MIFVIRAVCQVYSKVNSSVLFYNDMLFKISLKDHSDLLVKI